jgi:UDP-N-acetylglucosamine pyrophosphorylase
MSKAGDTHRASLNIQVSREEEFAPVKNANGAAYDTPDTAKLMLLRLHSRWVVAAGGFLTHSVPLYMTGNSLLLSASFWNMSSMEPFI